ncbi:hypothetical protein MUO14_17265 [Halobacillus shinanisalinarum]|uniref:DUF485 domain-containing protein n=1 Tax=Halobacillus shinanisalinarum TaxID=2932258 RepID=A0ABY4GW53_9BACI|nr:hypothetical protein [Halobacillus shinanisalinarum]UOQ92221.1 hypothetical protein MUO14_17265 [Halobacillus shinanisalinarum]
MRNFKKFLYGLFFVIIPFVYVVGFITWGYFVSNNAIEESVTDILSILGISYFLGSIFWYFNMDRIEKVSNQIQEESK